MDNTDLKRKKKIRPLSRKRCRLRKYGVANCSFYTAQINGSLQVQQAQYSKMAVDTAEPARRREWLAASTAASSASPASSISDEFERRFDFEDRIVDFVTATSQLCYASPPRRDTVPDTPPSPPPSPPPASTTTTLNHDHDDGFQDDSADYDPAEETRKANAAWERLTSCWPTQQRIPKRVGTCPRPPSNPAPPV